LIERLERRLKLVLQVDTDALYVEVEDVNTNALFQFAHSSVQAA
jgi:hypothetical protein